MKKTAFFSVIIRACLFGGYILSAVLCNSGFIVPSCVYGQEINAKVTSTLEMLPQNKRDDLYDFAPKLEQYLNSYDWTNGEYPYSLSCQVGVFFEEVRTTYEDRYSGRFYINTEMGTQYVDKYWDFAYNKGDQFNHGQADFSPLLGLVDFYIYLILGEEMDRIEALRGTQYFEKALDLANQGKFCRLPRWWDERYKDVQYLLSETHQPYRQMTALFENILFHMDEGNDVQAKDMSNNLLQMLKQLNGDSREQQYMERFYNQSYKELLAIAQFQDDPSYVQELIKLDPRHEDHYRNN